MAVPVRKALSVREVCDWLRISRWTVCRAIQRGDLPGAHKTRGQGRGGQWRIPFRAVSAWLSAGEVPEAANDQR